MTATPSSTSPDRLGAHLRAPRSIDDLLNYQLSRLTAFAGSAVIRLCEGRYGISRREWHLLALLAAHGPSMPSDLAAITHLDRARVSRAVAQLREKGLVKRYVVSGDHRRALIELTPAGCKLYERLFAEVAQLNVALVEALDPETLRAFESGLKLLQQRAQTLAREAIQDVHADRWKGIAQRSGFSAFTDDD